MITENFLQLEAAALNFAANRHCESRVSQKTKLGDERMKHRDHTTHLPSLSTLWEKPNK